MVFSGGIKYEYFLRNRFKKLRSTFDFAINFIFPNIF